MAELKRSGEQLDLDTRALGPRPQLERRSPVLSLREWEIWHSYASFYSDPLPPLEMVAQNLVLNGVAESALCSEGQAFWSNDLPTAVPKRAGQRIEPIGTGQVEINLKPDRVRASVQLPKGARGYALETLYQSSMMRYKERMLFGDESLPPRYVRAHLGVCVLIEGGPRPSSLVVYPQLKIFETGVVLVQFRLMGVTRPVLTEEFIHKYLNAPGRDFRQVLVPPGVAAWAPHACPSEGQFRWHRRSRAAWLIRYHQRAIPNHIQMEQGGGFEFPVVSLNLPVELEYLNRVTKGALPAAVEAGKRAVEEERGKLSPPAQEDTESREQQLLATGMRAAERVMNIARRGALRELPNSSDSFHTIALTMMAIAGHVAGARSNGPRLGFSLGLLGPGKRNELGNHWVGRPHVHLVRFAQQADTVTDNEAAFGNDFGSMIARGVIREPDVGRQYLPRSSRGFQDHGAYLASSATLWVHSGLAARQSRDLPWADPNRGQLVYEHQVKCELLEYGYALHRRIASSALDKEIDSARLLKAQQDLADFEWSVEDTGHFGEIRELLQTGWEALGVSRLRAKVSEGIRVRQEQAAQRSTRSASAWAGFLALIAGLLTVPPLARDVLTPLWRWQGWWQPADQNAAELMLVGVAICSLTAVLGTGYWWTRRKT